MPRVTALYGVLGIVVVGVVAMLLARPRALLSDDPVPGRPPVLPGAGMPSAEELAAVRFPVAVRGYRMADVDAYFAAASAALVAATQSAAELPDPELSGAMVPDSEQADQQPVTALEQVDEQPVTALEQVDEQPVTEQRALAAPAAQGVAVAAAAVVAAKASDTESPLTIPLTQTSGTATPETETPEAQIPGTETPDTQMPQTGTPETQIPRTEPASEVQGAPEATIAKTDSAETVSAETVSAETVSAETVSAETPCAETASAEPADMAGVATAEAAVLDEATDAVPPPQLQREQTSRSDIDAAGVADPVGTAPQVAETAGRQLPD